MSGESFARAVSATPHSTAEWLETLVSLLAGNYSTQTGAWPMNEQLPGQLD